MTRRPLEQDLESACPLLYLSGMKRTLNMTVNRYLVRSATNPALILTVSGEFIPESLCGPGGRCAKLYKTRRGAERAGSHVTVHPCTEHGIEV